MASPISPTTKQPGATNITSRAIPASLQKLIEDGVIDSVICPLKSGKEADIFIVEREPYHYVAKVYKERKFRSFKNDAGYREARTVRNTRAQRALTKGTRYGQKLAEKAWHTSEVDALRVLEAAGARVPRVLAHHDRVLIMELICDEKGQLAPQLAQVPLTKEGAREMYDTIIQQVVIMLTNDLVHGDLSPYNVLVRGGEPVIIDMPQCVSAAHNQQANRLLDRDILAISKHLGLIDPAIRKLGKLSWQIWSEYEKGTLTPEFKPDPERVRQNEVGDLGGLVDFVKTAAEEGDLERRAAEGDSDAQALLRAADRREAKRARKVAAARQEAAEAEAKAREKVERRTSKGKAKKKAKTRRGGGKSARTPTVTAKSSRTKKVAGQSSRSKKVTNTSQRRKKVEEPAADGQPKKKRRRRRRRRGNAGGGDGNQGAQDNARSGPRKPRSKIG